LASLLCIAAFLVNLVPKGIDGGTIRALTTRSRGQVTPEKARPGL
jgi:hypothetical protein